MLSFLFVPQRRPERDRQCSLHLQRFPEGHWQGRLHSDPRRCERSGGEDVSHLGQGCGRFFLSVCCSHINIVHIFVVFFLSSKMLLFSFFFLHSPSFYLDFIICTHSFLLTIQIWTEGCLPSWGEADFVLWPGQIYAALARSPLNMIPIPQNTGFL